MIAVVPHDVGVWVLIALVLIPAVKTVVDWSRKPGPQELLQPITIKASDDGPSRVEFDLHVKQFEELKTEIREYIREGRASQGAVRELIDGFHREQFLKRKPMHKQLNAHANALNYIAGRMANQGDKSGAEHVQKIITEAEKE